MTWPTTEQALAEIRERELERDGRYRHKVVVLSEYAERSLARYEAKAMVEEQDAQRRWRRR